MGPDGAEIKIGSTGEDKQQFTRVNWTSQADVGVRCLRVVSLELHCQTPLQSNSKRNQADKTYYLYFGPETSVFSVAVEKLKNYNMQGYNFARGSVWVWSLVSDIKRAT
jgi:hypothetical protein